MTSGVVARLGAEIDATLADLLPRDTPFALLDHPDYANVGDNAIYLGALRFFRRAGLTPDFTCVPARTDWDQLARTIGPEGAIFLSGGGNFGDLYDWAQDHREEVLRRFPGRPVIQLPQTITFRSPARIERAARAIAAHGAFTLCVRDTESRDLALRHFDCPVRLCPDMAFALGPLPRGAAEHSLLLLLRADEEVVDGRDAGHCPVDARIADWPDDPPDFHARVRRRVLAPALVAAARGGRLRARERLLRGFAEERLRRGGALLSQGQAVVTDRLHGHILCTLLDIPHVFLDNRHGKLSRFAGAWATETSRARFAATLPEAIAIAQASSFGRDPPSLSERTTP